MVRARIKMKLRQHSEGGLPSDLMYAAGAMLEVILILLVLAAVRLLAMRYGV
jgi:hypothetical protein